MNIHEIYQSINTLLNITKANSNNINLNIIANVKGHTKNSKDYSENSIETEFLSIDELNQLINSAHLFGLYTTVFYDIQDFMKHELNHEPSYHTVIFETTQKGIGKGKDSLLPSFCDIRGLLYTGSNASTNAVLSNKYLWTIYLQSHNIPVPISWKYNYKCGWNNSVYPNSETLLICKPVHECASIGIENNSISYLTQNYVNFIHNKSETYEQSMIVQEFIHGYEVEVPIISMKDSILVLPPIGLAFKDSIKMGKQILSYSKIYNDDYKFYSFYNQNKDITCKIIQCSKHIAELLELSGYSRIDFRIKENGNFFVTDINSYPHIVNHSSFAESFKIIGHDISTILPAIIGNAIENA